MRRNRVEIDYSKPHNFIYVNADENDGDYRCQLRVITDEQLAEIMPVIEAIRERNKLIEKKRRMESLSNWYTSVSVNETAEEMYPNLTEDQLDAFSEFYRNGEYGVHTISEIYIFRNVIREDILGR